MATLADLMKPKSLLEKGSEKGVQAANGFSEWVRKLPKRPVVGLTFILLAMILLSEPRVGIVAWLGQHGLSPKGYAYALAVCGGIILRWPQTRFYQLLVGVFLPYWVGAYGYTIDAGLNLAPVLLYGVMWFGMLLADE